MSFMKHLVALLLFGLFVPGKIPACALNSGGRSIAEQITQSRKQSPAAKIRAVFQAPQKVIQALKQQQDEKPSRLSTIALYVFFGSYGLLVLANYLPFLKWIAVGGAILGFLLALIVLATETNTRSRKMAKAVVITGIVVTAVVLAAIWALKTLFPDVH